MGSMSLTIYLVRNMVTPIERPILMTICSPRPRAVSAPRAGAIYRAICRTCARTRARGAARMLRRARSQVVPAIAAGLRGRWPPTSPPSCS